MKKIILILILVLASALRLWQLGQVPHGITVDEAAIGYNAYAVFTTRRDEWLERLPISFRSFGDYKAPAAIYLLGPVIYFLGSEMWVLRLPFALFGIAAAWLFYLLIREIFYDSRRRETLALLGAFLLATSPWHLHFSRLGFEAGMALTLTVGALYLFYAYLRQGRWWQLGMAVLLAAATLYTYHSNKLITPLLFTFLAWQHRHQLWRRRRSVSWALLGGLLLLLPFLYDALWLNGLTRMQSSTVLTQAVAPLQKATAFLTNLSSYLHPDFLLRGQTDGNLRHGDGRFGVLSWPTYLLALSAPIWLWWRRRQLTKTTVAASAFIYWYLLVALAPAALAIDPQHSVRSLSAAPALLLLAVLSLHQFAQLPRRLWRLCVGLLVAAEILSLLLYQRHYYQDYARLSADTFHSGYVEVFSYLKDTDKQQVQQIIFTNDYEHAYIHALFVFRLSPLAWQGGLLNIFKFTEQINAGDLAQPNTIVVASQYDDMGEAKSDHQIVGSDGEVKFKIFHQQ